ncbi:ECF transporter S component [Cumulibacter manganitolerans]|uniref:ECF transporter S component n=1 Tax=Cumulibacter manganitolerans TaxID=1884992 RepID=UPI0012979E4E|nr:ECF transporter S component [Cumulibacter manganitolerans]
MSTSETDRIARKPSVQRGWRLHDLVLIAVLGAVFGFLYYALVQAWLALSIAMGPSGDLAQNILWGGWMVVAPLALYITRKPGAGIVAEVIASVIEVVVLGSPVGPKLFLTALVQGVGVELVFAATRYRRWTWGTFALSGLVGGAAIFVYEASVLGWWGQSIVVWRAIIHLASCVVLCGLLAKALGDLLVRTGVLDNFAVVRDLRDRR